MRGVVTSGVAMFTEDQLLNIVSDGVLIERYFTYSYSPMFIEGSKIGNTNSYYYYQRNTKKVFWREKLKNFNRWCFRGCSRKYIKSYW